jgi:hypothetical protein
MSTTSRLDALPVELVDKIMESKKTLEMQDELTKLRKPVDHTDLPLTSEFPYTSHMKRIRIDTEYLDIFHERHFFIHYTHAVDDVVQTLARFDGFERRNHGLNAVDGLRAYVADRITQICGLLAAKFGHPRPDGGGDRRTTHVRQAVRGESVISVFAGFTRGTRTCSTERTLRYGTTTTLHPFKKDNIV